jgi:NADH:ubiquinone oxidoreductase subunit E
MSAQILSEILEDRKSQPHQLIEVLQDVQEQQGYISEDSMAVISKELGVPILDVYRVASFYKAFSLKPSGKNVITVCTGTACHVRGANLVVNQASSQLRTEPGEMTDDGLFTVKHVNCLGACALGPVVTENGSCHHHMTPGKIRKLINSIQKDETKENPND